MTNGDTKSHPFVSHYETRDERARAQQLDVIAALYATYGRSRTRTREALCALMWNATEASRAVTDMQDRLPLDQR